MPSFGSDFDEIARTFPESLGADPGPSAAGSDANSGPPFRLLLLVLLDQQKGTQGARIIEALDREGWSGDPEALSGADPQELADALRDHRGAVPSSLVPILRRVADWVVGHGGMEALAAVGTETLRDELRAIRGLGPQTADRMLLEALGRPTFPVSRSDYRILIRHGWIDPTADYDEAREIVEGVTAGDPALTLRLSEWLGSLAGCCRVASPRCDRCALRPWLPEGGPLDPS